jgi:hypothetical protein
MAAYAARHSGRNDKVSPMSRPAGMLQGRRLQIGTMAGFKSERVAGFNLECMAGFVGIRRYDE